MDIHIKSVKSFSKVVIINNKGYCALRCILIFIYTSNNILHTQDIPWFQSHFHHQLFTSIQDIIYNNNNNNNSGQL